MKARKNDKCFNYVPSFTQFVTDHGYIIELENNTYSYQADQILL